MTNVVKFAVKETRDTKLGLLRPGILYSVPKSIDATKVIDNLKEQKVFLSADDFESISNPSAADKAAADKAAADKAAADKAAADKAAADKAAADKAAADKAAADKAAADKAAGK